MGRQLARSGQGVQAVARELVINAGSAALDASIAAMADGGEIALTGLFDHADWVATIDDQGTKPLIDRTFAFEEAKEAAAPRSPRAVRQDRHSGGRVVSWGARGGQPLRQLVMISSSLFAIAGSAFSIARRL